MPLLLVWDLEAIAKTKRNLARNEWVDCQVACSRPRPPPIYTPLSPGVEDVGAAQELLEFARKLELLLPKEADSVEAVELGLADAEGLAAGVQK